MVNAYRRLEEADDPADRDRILRELLLVGFRDLKIGLYSRMHEKAIYTRGYGNRESVRLAWMYVMITSILLRYS